MPEKSRSEKTDLSPIAPAIIVDIIVIMFTFNPCFPNLQAIPVFIILTLVGMYYAHISKRKSLLLFCESLLIAYIPVFVLLAFTLLSGVYNCPTAILGTACTAAPGFLCQNPILQQNGTLGFTFGINQGTQTIYNMMMACAATANTGGYPNNAQAFTVVNSIGVAVGTVPQGNSITLASGQTVQVSNLVCYGIAGLPVGTNSTPAPIGTAFSGFLWLNYTNNPGLPFSVTNPWQTQKVATVTVKVV